MQSSRGSYIGDKLFSQLSWFNTKRVKEARVMVVGVGALGNEVLKNLALFGVEHIVIVDFDLIERSNISRSVLFRESDAGLRKIDVAEERIKEINVNIKVEKICGDITYEVGLGLMAQMDVIIACLDNRYARYTLCRSAFRVDVPWVDGGIDGLEGTVRVFKYGENCYACNLGEVSLKEMARHRSCASIVTYNSQSSRIATTPVIASIIGAAEVQEAMKLIHKEELEAGRLTSLCGKMLYWEGEHMSTKVVAFKEYHSDCPLHHRWDKIISTELSAECRVADVVEYIERELGYREVEIVLGNRTFVEYIERRDDQQRIEVMLPSYRVAQFVESEPSLEGVAFEAIYQHEHKRVSGTGKLSQLTLQEIGIPQWDIIAIDCSQGRRYIELKGDLKYFKALFAETEKI